MPYYSDGKVAKLHEALINKNDNNLEFIVNNERHIWDFKDIILIDREFYKISNKNDDDVRLTLSKEDYDSLKPKVKCLNDKFNRHLEFKLIGGLILISAIFAIIIFYGIPMMAVPLSKITSKSFEERIGKSTDSQLDLGFNFCKPNDNNKQIILENLSNKIAKNAKLDFPLKLGVLDTPMTNAFAMPAGHIYLTRGLLNDAKNSEELAAVISHEVSHLESKDVLVSLYRVLGYSILLDAIVGGGSGVGQQAILWGANLTDLKHSRDIESRADLRGLELLESANIDGTGMASFFKTLEEKSYLSNANIGDTKIKDTKIGEWLEYASSHQDSGKRSDIAAQKAKKGQKALSEQEFALLKSYCEN